MNPTKLKHYSSDLDDTRWSLKKEEISEIEDAVRDRHPEIEWEVRPIYGYGVSLICTGIDGMSQAQYKVAGKRGKDRASMEDILKWSDTASMVISDESLSKDTLGDSLGMNRVVTCRHCDKAVYRLRDGVGAGDPIDAEDFKGLNGFPDPSNGEPVLCPSCGGSIMGSVQRTLNATH